MKALIIEDEKPAAKRLADLIQAVKPGIQIVGHLDSVAQSVSWFSDPDNVCDLVFMDIQLADGLSFSIFRKCDVKVPTIFTTAFDQYMMDAFKVNSIEYLLKPVNEEELLSAIQKYESMKAFFQPIGQDEINRLIGEIKKPVFKKRFLVRAGKELLYIPIQQVAYFYSEDGLTFLKSRQGHRSVIDHSIEQVDQMLDPAQFFRISRKFIVSIDSIDKIHNYFNGRLRLDLIPDTDAEVTVSRDRVGDFKAWLDE